MTCVRVRACVRVRLGFVVAITLMCYELSSDTSKSAEMQIDFRLKIVILVSAIFPKF